MTSQTIAQGRRSFFGKVAQFPLARIFLACLFVFIAVVLAQGIISLLGMVVSLQSPPVELLSALIASLLVFGAYYAYVHLIEQRAVAELSGDGALGEFGAGALAGAGLFALIIFILWALGSYQVLGLNPWMVLIPVVVANVPSGLIQEIIFRGVVFRITEESLGSWIALAISAALFGLVHVLIEQATLFSTISIMLEAGVLLGAAYMLTHRLWLAIGLHIGWDLANDGIFGVGSAGLSGTPMQGLLQGKLSGPAWLSGGAAGVEASIVAVVVLLAVSVYLIWKAKHRGHILPPAWRRGVQITSSD